MKLQVGSYLGDLKHKLRQGLSAAPVKGNLQGDHRGVVTGQHESREYIREVKVYRKDDCDVKSTRGCWFVGVFLVVFFNLMGGGRRGCS